MELFVRYKAFFKEPGKLRIEEKTTNLFRVKMEKVRQFFCRYIMVKLDQRIAQIEDYDLVTLIDYTASYLDRFVLG